MSSCLTQGKWVNRIVVSLIEAGGMLSPKLLLMQCGATTSHSKKSVYSTLEKLCREGHVSYSQTDQSWHLNDDTAALLEEKR